jgi:hypothetical protein
MCGRTYLIKDIQWKEFTYAVTEKYTFHSIFGSIWVQRDRQEYLSGEPWGNWRWGYCFDEYYDEGSEGRQAQGGEVLS